MCGISFHISNNSCQRSTLKSNQVLPLPSSVGAASLVHVHFTRIVSVHGARTWHAYVYTERTTYNTYTYIYIFIRELLPFNSLVWGLLTLAPINRFSEISRACKSTHLVFSCDIRSILKQQLHNFYLALSATNVERCSSILDHGKVGQKKLHTITEFENIKIHKCIYSEQLRQF